MERCDVETVYRSFFKEKEEKRGGQTERSLWLEKVLGFLSKGRDLQDLINSVNSRTLFPKRF